MVSQFHADDAEFLIWYQNGVNRGWVSPMVCLFHDGVGLSHEEILWADSGEEPCVWTMRFYANARERLEVERAHPPSLWRRQDG